MSRGGKTDKVTMYEMELVPRGRIRCKEQGRLCFTFSPKGNLDPAFSVTPACPIIWAILRSSLATGVSMGLLHLPHAW